jgi:hypothetical protein
MKIDRAINIHKIDAIMETKYFLDGAIAYALTTNKNALTNGVISNSGVSGYAPSAIDVIIT